MPELLNAARDREAVEACTSTATPDVTLDHDYRPYDAPDGPGHTRTYLRCVFCHAAACGTYDDPDPCIEPWHHEPKAHRTATGATWPIGESRP